MEKNKELQGKFVEFKSLKEQIEHLNEYIKNTSEQIETIAKVVNNLKEISELKKGSELLVPISNGVYVKVQVEDNQKFIVNIGSDTVIERDMHGVEELMSKQRKELVELHAKMMSDLDKMESKAIALQNEIKGMIE